MTTHALEQWLKDKKDAGERVRKGDLAKTVDCSPARISQIVNGGVPSLALASRLSKATGIPLDSFVKQDEAAQ